MPKFSQKAKMAKGKQITIQVPHACEVRVTQTSAHTFLVEADEWEPPKSMGIIVPPSAGQLVRPA